MLVLLDLPVQGRLEAQILFSTEVMVKPRSTVTAVKAQWQRIPTPPNSATVVTAAHAPVALAFSPLRTTLARGATEMRLLG